MSTIRPTEDRLILTDVDWFQHVDTTLEVPDQARGGSVRVGTVQAVGPGRTDKYGNYVPMEVESGERVLFHRRSGTQLDVGDEQFWSVPQSGLLAVLEGV